MAITQIPTSVTIISSGLKGYLAVSLTNWATSGLSAIAAGSALEICNAFFITGSETAINASSWTAITTAGTAYLELTPAGTAGVQTVTARWSATDPTWSEAKQGWYHSSASVIRTIASTYKVSNTQQGTKTLYTNGRNRIFNKKYAIPAWNMDTTIGQGFIAQIENSKILSWNGWIRNDGNTYYYPVDYATSSGLSDIKSYLDTSLNQIAYTRRTGGYFDGADFDSVAFDRGITVVIYEA